MKLDRKLIQEAQMKAGKDVHKVASLLQTYQTACELNDAALCELYELKLRVFVKTGKIT